MNREPGEPCRVLIAMGADAAAFDIRAALECANARNDEVRFDVRLAPLEDQPGSAVRRADTEGEAYAMVFTSGSLGQAGVVPEILNADRRCHVVVVTHPEDEGWSAASRGAVACGRVWALRKPVLPVDVLQVATLAVQHRRLDDQTRATEIEQAGIEQERRQSERLREVGRLASGIAHEINTPIQFVHDSACFLQDAWADLTRLVEVYDELFRNRLAAASSADKEELELRLAQAAEEADLAFIREEVPEAFDRTFDGLERVAGIVRAMKEFSHPGRLEKDPEDLNRAIGTTLTVARGEYKNVAEVECELGAIPKVVCAIRDVSQVLLNLVVNAAHAISEANHNSRELGRIRITTRREGDHVEISISDTGAGIPAHLQGRIFDPFFTTKAAGQGTGQGLALARTVIVENHAGQIHVDSKEGQGTTFTILLPIDGGNRVEDCEVAIRA